MVLVFAAFLFCDLKSVLLKKEEDLKNLANIIREQRSGIKQIKDDKEAIERDEIRRERHKDRVKNRAIERAAPEKRTQLMKDKDRDISEKIALGLPNIGHNNGDIQFDSRLFDTSKGLDTGFGDEEGYTVYDKPWREAESLASSVYRPSKNIDKEYGDDFEKAMTSKRFVPDKGFEGAERTGPRDGPVSFQQHHQDVNFDPFQIDDFLGNLKTGNVTNTNASKRSNEDELKHKNSSSARDRETSETSKRKRK